MSDKVEDILFQAHSEGIWKEVLDESKHLGDNGKYFYRDKIEAAYNIVKTKKEKRYENTNLGSQKRSNKR